MHVFLPEDTNLPQFRQAKNLLPYRVPLRQVHRVGFRCWRVRPLYERQMFVQEHILTSLGVRVPGAVPLGRFPSPFLRSLTGSGGLSHGIRVLGAVPLGDPFLGLEQGVVDVDRDTLVAGKIGRAHV